MLGSKPTEYSHDTNIDTETKGSGKNDTTDIFDDVPFHPKSKEPAAPELVLDDKYTSPSSSLNATKTLFPVDDT